MDINNKEFTFWTEGYSCYDKYPSLEKCIEEARYLYDRGDDDVFGFIDEDETEINPIINVGVVHTIDIDEYANDVLGLISDWKEENTKFHPDRVSDFINERLYDFWCEGEIECYCNKQADTKFIEDYHRWEDNKDNNEFLSNIKLWLETVIPDFYTAWPLKDCYDLSKHIWVSY